jgi:ketosteroid isomerase-like protein
MKNQVLIILLVFPLYFASACRNWDKVEAQPKVNIEADVAAIKVLEEEFVRLYNACEFDKLMAVFYTEDAVLMAPEAPAVKGKDALLRGYRKDDEVNIEYVETSVVEDVRVSGDLAVARGRDTGTTTARKGGKPFPYDLKWVMAFERQADRTWKCCYEIWCENSLSKAPEAKQPN